VSNFRGLTGNGLSKIVLKCSNIKKMKTFVPKNFVTEYEGQEAIKIENISKDKKTWDIYVI